MPAPRATAEGHRLRRFILLAAVAFVLWLLARGMGWKKTRHEGGQTEWRRGAVTQLDENGDGVVDEERIALPEPGGFRVRRDTDRDGWFDVRYELRNGIATGVGQIRERAPAR
jgi:hypothetical protein